MMNSERDHGIGWRDHSRHAPSENMNRTVQLSTMASATGVGDSKGILVAARHGEREDYIQRDAGENWIATADRPWDPPLSSAGHQQVRELGRRVARSLVEHGLPP